MRGDGRRRAATDWAKARIDTPRRRLKRANRRVPAFVLRKGKASGKRFRPNLKVSLMRSMLSPDSSHIFEICTIEVETASYPVRGVSTGNVKRKPTCRQA